MCIEGGSAEAIGSRGFRAWKGFLEAEAMPWPLKSLLLPALLFQERMGAEMEFPSARQGSESNAASPDVPERLQAIDALARTC